MSAIWMCASRARVRDPLRQVREQAHRLVELARLAQEPHQREDHLGLCVVAGVGAARGVRAIARDGGAQGFDRAGDGVAAQLGLGQEQRRLAPFGVRVDLGAQLEDLVLEARAPFAAEDAQDA